MKRIVAFIFMLQACTAYSQFVQYTYDAAGNRISRVSSQLIQTQQSQSEPEQNNSSRMLGDKNITIYPNPTEGNLRIEILGISDEDTYSLSLYNATGQRLFYKGCASTTTRLDIRKQPAGTYFLHIAKNDEQERTWKIIKK